MACPLRCVFRLPTSGWSSGVIPALPRRLCSSATSQEVTVRCDEVTMMAGVSRVDHATRAEHPSLPANDGFTKKIGSLAKDLHIPMEHIGVLRQALTDRSFSERIYHARREAGNRVETLEPDHHNERLALLGQSAIYLAVNSKLMLDKDVALTHMGVHDICTMAATDKVVLNSILPHPKDEYIRTASSEVSGHCRMFASKAVVGAILQTKGEGFCLQYLGEKLRNLDAANCRRLLKAYHARFTLIRVLQHKGLPTPVIRVVEDTPGEVQTLLMSGDKQLAVVDTSSPFSRPYQISRACQRAMYRHFVADLGNVLCPHTHESPEPAPYPQIPDEDEMSIPRTDGKSEPFTAPDWNADKKKKAI